MYGQATVEGTGGASPGLAAKSARWAGRVTSTLVAAFLLFDGCFKVMMLEPAVEGSVRLGYPEGTVFGIGLALLVGTALYAVPRTAFLGAILLTGYLGGAVATQVRVEDP
jgi:DoxX-like family